MYTHIQTRIYIHTYIIVLKKKLYEKSQTENKIS